MTAMRRGISALLILLLSLGLCAPSARAQETPLPADFRLIAENDRFVLGLNTGNCFFCVIDKRLGTIYHSNPSDWADDALANGSKRAYLRSHLNVTVYDAESDSAVTLNSYSASVSKGTVKLSKMEDGLKIRYTFEDYGIMIPLCVALGENCFRVYVETGEIEETGDARLLDIELVPMLAAADRTQTGYILLPDGSGSLLYLNNGKGQLGAYRAQVYGQDPTFAGTLAGDSVQRAALPVLGFCFESDGLLGVASKGDSQAFVNAAAAGGNNSYNAAWFSFTLRARGEYAIGEENYSTRTVSLYQQERAADERFEVTWYPLDAAECDYIGMARRYQKILFGDALPAASDEYRLHLNLYGMVYKDKPVLGIPVSQPVALSTYRQAVRLLESLEEEGVPASALYLNWTDNVALNKRGALSPSAVLGGQGDYDLLKETAQKLSVPLYLNADSLSFSTRGALLSRFTQTANALSSYPTILYRYRLSTWKRDEEKPTQYALAADKVQDALLDDAKQMAALNDGLSLGNAASQMYSDFSRPDGGRLALRDAVHTAYAEIARGARLCMTFPNAYALPLADFANDVPSASSGFSVTDEDVPFYAYVLRGCVPFATEAVNLADEPRATFLFALETGAALSYTWVLENAEELRRTDESGLYACAAEDWQETAKAWYREAKTVFDATSASDILSRTNENGLVTVSYQNGSRLLLNYTRNDATVDGERVEAMGYRLITP